MFAIAASIDSERLRGGARTLTAFRLFETLIAWYFVTHTLLAVDAGLKLLGLAQLIFFTYFVFAVVGHRRFTAEKLSDAALRFDLALTLGAFVFGSAVTFGLRSPLNYLLFSQVLFYGAVFSPIVGLTAMVSTVVAFIIVVLGPPLLAIDWLPPQSLALDGPAEIAVHGAAILCALMSAVWLFQSSWEMRQRSQQAAQRSRRAAEREHGSASVAGALLSVSEAISRLTSLDHVLDTVVEIAPRVLQVDSCGVFLWDEERSLYHAAAASGLDAAAYKDWLGCDLSPTEVPDMEWVRHLGHCAVLGPREAARVGVPDAPAVLTAPLLSGGQFFGAVFFARRGGQSFTQSDFRLADGVARQTAVAIERAELVARQAHLQENLARADRLAGAGALAAGVAHEVNNALVAILGEADIARDHSTRVELLASMRRVEQQGLRIAEIVQELLGFARPDTPKRESIQLAQVVRETIDLITHEFDRYGVRVTVNAEPSGPPVLADPKQIQQVLINLLTNASQALSSAGGGSITVTVRAIDDRVEVAVSDDGPGITAEALPRIFDPFYSAKPTGTGLGLSVSYQIVRAHGGDLSAESELGHGATFRMRLPQATPDLASSQRILLVDDDDNVAASLNDMLKRDGRQVERVASGREALDRLMHESFDAILLDVRLPDVSGPDVYRELAEKRPTQAQRVIFVTGGLWRGNESGLRQSLPPRPLLSKPCTAPQLRAVLRLLDEPSAA